MTEIVRAALTQTKNAFADMPATVEDLSALAGRMDEVRAANLAHSLALIEAAAAVGVRILCLGELFPAPYFALHESAVWFELAEDALAGPTVAALGPAAERYRMVLVAPLYELDKKSGKRFNTAVVLDADGRVLGRYRKTHIPSGTNEVAAFHETFYYERSDGQLANGPANLASNPYFPVFGTAVGKVGVAICYDRHFEGAVRSLAHGGAQIVFSPAVTFGDKSRRLWELEFQVDAARHGVFVGGSNRRGAEAPWNVEFFGASYFAGPDGRLDPRDAPDGLVVYDLDLDSLAKGDTSGWDLRRDERPDIYSA